MLLALIGTACVIVLTYYASKWYARKMGPIAGGKHIKIVDRLVVSKTGSLLIIDIEGKQYMMGVSEQNVQVLMRLDETIPLPIEQNFGGDGLRGLVNKEGLMNAFKKWRGVD